MNGVLCQVRIPMDDAVARAVVWVVAQVVVKSRFLDFRGLILIVPVFHIVVFEAMEMWVMGCHLGEIRVGGGRMRLRVTPRVGVNAFSLDGERACGRAQEERDAKRQWASATVGREEVKG